MKGLQEIDLKEAVNLLINEKEQSKVFIRKSNDPDKIVKAILFTWDFERTKNDQSLFNVKFYKEVNDESEDKETK